MPVYRTRTLFLSCHSEPVTDVTGVGIRLAAPAGAESLASLCEGGVTAFGRDGGRDMPRKLPLNVASSLLLFSLPLLL